MGKENRAQLGIRFPGRPARNELLYRLRYPGLLVASNINLFFEYNDQETTAVI